MTSPESPQRRRSFIETACAIQPYHVFLIGLIPGFSLVFGSLLLGIASWNVPVAKCNFVAREVGYLPALNWSVTYAILFPLALYLMVITLSSLAYALNQMHETGMVRDRELNEIREPVLTASWLTGSPTRAKLVWGFAVVVPGGFALIEWFRNNLLRLLHFSEASHCSEYDWGLAGIMAAQGQPEWSPAFRVLNAFFDLVAFASEALLIGSLMAFFLAVLDLGRILPTGRLGETFVVLPDLKSTDKRLGFEKFAAPLEKLLTVALVAYLMCYLVRLQGAYMASSGVSSLADFVTEDILAGVRQAAAAPTPKNLVSAFTSLVNFSEQQPRGVLAWMMSVLIAAFSFCTVAFTVRDAAITARNNALAGIRDGRLQLVKSDQSTAARKVNSMVVWPLGYLKLDLLLFWMAVAVLTLLLYRIGLFIAGIVAFSLFVRALKRLILSGRAVTSVG